MGGAARGRAVVLHASPLPVETALLAGLREVIEERRPPHDHARWVPHVVAMTNCGLPGWVTDRRRIPIRPRRPGDGRTWPRMPESWSSLAGRRGGRGGVRRVRPGRLPCHRYDPGASSPSIRTERARLRAADRLRLPGAPGVFLFGGLQWTEKKPRAGGAHARRRCGMGGPARLRYHGVCRSERGITRSWAGIGSISRFAGG